MYFLSKVLHETEIEKAGRCGKMINVLHSLLLLDRLQILNYFIANWKIRRVKVTDSSLRILQVFISITKACFKTVVKRWSKNWRLSKNRRFGSTELQTNQKKKVVRASTEDPHVTSQQAPLLPSKIHHRRTRIYWQVYG